MFKYVFFVFSVSLLFLGCQTPKKDTVVEEQNPRELWSYDLKTDDFGDLLRHRSIRSLSIWKNDLLLDLNFFEKLSDFENLESIWIGNSNNIKDLEPLKYLQNLKNLTIRNCDNITNFEPLKYLQNLEYLALTVDASGILDISAIRYLQKLEYLQIFASGIVDISAVKYLQSLTSFTLLYYNKVENIEAFFEAPKIKSVQLHNCSEFMLEFGMVSSSSSLEDLLIFSPSMEVDLKYIGTLQKLNHLSVYAIDMHNIFTLKNPELKNLDLLYDDYGEFNLNWLSNLTNLENLRINNRDIKDTSPLLKLPNLSTIDFVYSNFDPMPLLKSNSIKFIYYCGEGKEKRKDFPEELFMERGIAIYFDDAPSTK